MSPSVAVVILNWNGKNLLQKFLPSVLRSDYENLSIIVGDNASTDGSIEFLAENFPTVQVIQNEENYGYAGGYNKVLDQVRADYLVLLNSDVEVPEDWIRPVIEMMEHDPQIAAAQPKIKWQLHKELFEYAGAAGGYLDRYGFPFCRGRIFQVLEPDQGQYNENAEIFWASGAAFFIRHACWVAAGGFDEDLFAHMEEIDLCWRLKNKNYKIFYCSGSEVYHVGGATLDAENPFKTYLNFRNNLMIMQKNLPGQDRLKRIAARLVFDYLAMVQFLLSGKLKLGFAVAKAHRHFFKAAGKTAKKREGLQLSYRHMVGVYWKSIVLAFFVRKTQKFQSLK